MILGDELVRRLRAVDHAGHAGARVGPGADQVQPRDPRVLVVRPEVRALGQPGRDRERGADVVRTYDMVDGGRGERAARKLRRKSFSPSLFVVHFGTTGAWPDVPHHTILFGPRYQGLLSDIYRGSDLAEDPSLYIHHPTASDSGMAPDGHSTFYALAPVPHLGKAPLDWDVEGPRYRDRILQIVEERLLPGLRGRLGPVFHYTPSDFENDLNSHLGSAFSLEPRLTQSAWFRVHNRDDEIENLYFVGAGTHPGAGIPGVVGSAKATAGLMLADLAA